MYDYFRTRDAIWARSDLSFTEKGVALAALSFRNSKTGLCAPAVESDDPEKKTLCSKTGLTRICVRKTLKALEAKGVITLKKHSAKPSEITFITELATELREQASNEAIYEYQSH